MDSYLQCLCFVLYCHQSVLHKTYQLNQTHGGGVVNKMSKKIENEVKNKKQSEKDKMIKVYSERWFGRAGANMSSPIPSP